jgi:hypothetical protein
VTVTAGPLSSRLASIARGTGEVDALHYIAYDALAASVAANGEIARKGIPDPSRPAPAGS